MSIDPQTVVADLNKRLTQALESARHFGDIGEFEAKRIAREIDNLARQDAFEAFRLRAVLLSILGDEVGAVEQMIKAEKLGRPLHELQANRMFHLSNFGRASDTVRELRGLMKPGNPHLSSLLQASIPAGGATTALAAVEAATVAGHVLPSHSNAHVAVVREISRALGLAGRTEDELAALIDVAGDVQREARLFWLGRGPDIFTLDGTEGDDSAPGVHYVFHVDVTPERAAEMTWEVASRSVDRDVAREGLSVAFMGVQPEAQAAA